MKTKDLITLISGNELNATLVRLYGEGELASQKERYINAIRSFEQIYGIDRDASIFSVPGRSEISGNHTDHNHGCVIAGSINLDIIAVASKTADTTIRVKSEGFDEDIVNFAEYTSPKSELYGTSASIIAGMCAGFSSRGYAIGGFDAYTTSNVFKGSGLSSSAAFEDMIGNIENHFYNDGRVDNVEIAKLAQFSENEFFGKPCGLMDQVACAAGGIVAIDFADPSTPIIDKLSFDISAEGYNLCIVNTGGNHADLTDDYASVPAEMKSVAAAMGKSFLRDTDEDAVIASIAALRESLGDRAILRAIHFFEENKRVASQKQALLDCNVAKFFEGVLASGRSSFCYLQNVYTSKNLREQGLSLALCLADNYLAGKDAAWRVHGGGFAGTIQAFIRGEDVEGFRALMDSVFGKGACHVLFVRPDGAIKVC